MRDVLQHMHIRNGLRAIQNVVLSGVKYLALTSFPPNDQPSLNERSIEKKEPLPSVPSLCTKQDYCVLGNITDGSFYKNNINCPPFNFPLNKSMLVQPSHKQFPKEHDEIHVYAIDDELKQIVQQYDKSCPGVPVTIPS